MKRHLIFPALALAAALSTTTLAGWGSDRSTEVSDAIAAQASGGAPCSYWTPGSCGLTGPPGCLYTAGWVLATSGSYYTATGYYCGVAGCGTIYKLNYPCATVTSTTVAPPAS